MCGVFLKSSIYLIDKLFPKIKIVERIPFGNDTKNLLRTRMYNYRNRKKIQSQIEEYFKAKEL